MTWLEGCFLSTLFRSFPLPLLRCFKKFCYKFTRAHSCQKIPAF